MAQMKCSLDISTFQNIIKGLSVCDAKCKAQSVTLNVSHEDLQNLDRTEGNISKWDGTLLK